MTTIAYRDGVMAGDSQISADGVRVGEGRKVRRLGNWLVGCAGSYGIMSEFFHWFEHECVNGLKRPPETLLQSDDKYPISVLLVNKDNSVYGIDGVGYPHRLFGKYHAIGSGRDFALGAMAMGADARKAVKAAMMHDTHTGGVIRLVTFK